MCCSVPRFLFHYSGCSYLLNSLLHSHGHGQHLAMCIVVQREFEEERKYKIYCNEIVFREIMFNLRGRPFVAFWHPLAMSEINVKTFNFII